VGTVTSPLGDFVAITFQSTPDTPAAALPLTGLTFYFPPEYLSAIGSGPTNPGVIKAAGQRIRGYLDATNPASLTWVMTNELSAALQAQVDAIPGEGGWARPASRALYIGQGRDLVRIHGVPAADVVALFAALYTAAALNRDAQLAD
jgi:hypothetical protein